MFGFKDFLRFSVLFYVFDFVDRNGFGIKKALIVHPFIIKYFAHIPRSMIWENYHNITFFRKFTFLLQLFNALHCGATGIANEKPFSSGKFAGGMCTAFICYFLEFVNNIEIGGGGDQVFSQAFDSVGINFVCIKFFGLMVFLKY